MDFDEDELAALLSDSPNKDKTKVKEKDADDIEEFVVATTVWQEAKFMMLTAIPISFATLCRVAMNTTDSIFVGHLGPDKFAAATLAQVVMQSTNIILLGVGYCLNTLVSFSVGGKQHLDAGVWLQLSIVLSLMLCLPIGILWAFIGPLLKIFIKQCQEGGDSNQCDMAGIFAQYSLLSLLPMALHSMLRQYLQAQYITLPTTIVAALTVALNVGTNQVFIYGVAGWSGFGFIGSPLATATSQWVQLILLYSYAILWKKLHVQTWGGWNKASLKKERIKQFLRQAFPIMLSLAIEEWLYELVLLLVGIILVEDTLVSAQSIFFQLWIFFWAAFWGFAASGQIRVAWYLGQRNILLAKRASRIGLITAAVVATVCSCGIAALRFVLPAIFSSDAAVVSEAAEAMVPFAAAYLMSSLSLSANAVLDGMGRPGIASIITFVCEWMINLPLSCLLGFVPGNMGLPGLWVGAVSAETVRFLCAWGFVMTTDWNKLQMLRERD